ncbi:hypothetical protein [Nocardiopsis ganjiahuensis]|uniref:hypothetical protein n=1 Tax=Nocardiopsis ganjiahuensis TaxID=239984 RepID=UPI0003760806|nr:hypothetical protein [Nocardiopsis ganjiahuensis]
MASRSSTAPRPAGSRALRLWALGAAAWTLLYVVSKVVHAVEGRLGVTGGPRVDPDSYASYGPGDVAAAQWANAGVGTAVVLLFVLCALPVVRSLPRWLPAVPVGLVTLMAVAGTVGMVGRALLTASGGAGFGIYCAVWAVLAAGVLVCLLRRS